MANAFDKDIAFRIAILNKSNDNVRDIILVKRGEDPVAVAKKYIGKYAGRRYSVSFGIFTIHQGKFTPDEIDRVFPLDSLYLKAGEFLFRGLDIRGRFNRQLRDLPEGVFAEYDYVPVYGMAMAVFYLTSDEKLLFEMQYCGAKANGRTNFDLDGINTVVKQADELDDALEHTRLLCRE